MASGALMDLNDDGAPEVFVVGYKRRIVACYNGATGALVWSRTLSGTAYFYRQHSVLLLPVPPDTGRVILMDESGKVYGLRASTGDSLWAYSNSNVSKAYGAPAGGDVNGDGVPEVVCPVYGRLSGLIVLNPINGSLIAKDSIGYYCDTYTPSLDNFDAEPALEIAVLYRGESSPYPPMLSLRNWTGSGFSPLWIYNGFIWGGNPGSFVPPASTAVGDLNGDGRPDVVFHWADTIVVAVNGTDGSLLWYNFRKRIDDEFRGSPSLADVDGDSRHEVVITGVNCQGEGMMYFFEHDGKLKGVWDVIDAQSSAELAFDIEASFGDTDADGKIEVISITPDPNLMVIDGASTWQREPLCGNPISAEEKPGGKSDVRLWTSGRWLFLETDEPEFVDLKLYDGSGRLTDILFSGWVEKGTACFGLEGISGVRIAILRTPKEMTSLSLIVR